MYSNQYGNNNNYGANNMQGQGQQKGRQSEGGIWRAMSRKGQEYFKIKIGDQWYSAFVNNYKNNNPKAPDYVILKSDMMQQGNGQAQGANGYKKQYTQNYQPQGQPAGQNPQPYKKQDNPYGQGNQYQAKTYANQQPTQPAPQPNVVNGEDAQNAYYNAYSQQASFEEVDNIPDLPGTETPFPQF